MRPRSNPRDSKSCSRRSSASTASSAASELAAALGETLRADVDILNNTNLYTPHLFGLWVAQDLNDPKRYLPFLLQGGLGMPDREYYSAPHPPWPRSGRNTRRISPPCSKFAGIDAPETRAANIFELERRMAEVHWTRAASEQIEAGNNHWSRAQFYTPGRRTSIGAPSSPPPA